MRNWIEYGFKQIKNELGWADFRLTDYPSLERWWEAVISAYLLVSIQANYFRLETLKVEAQPRGEDSFLDSLTVVFKKAASAC